MTRVFVVAGVATGVGKTSVTLGLLEALRRRGLRVSDPYERLADVVGAALDVPAIAKLVGLAFPKR